MIEKNMSAGRGRYARTLVLGVIANVGIACGPKNLSDAHPPDNAMVPADAIAPIDAIATTDSGVDSRTTDAGSTDTSVADTPAIDSSPPDAPATDSSPPDATPIVDVVTDAGPPDSGPRPPATLVFAVRQLSIDADDDWRIAHTGFDLDHLASRADEAAGCLHEDFFSVLDPDQNVPSGCVGGSTGCVGGVDNQLPTLANVAAVFGMDYRGALADRVARHQTAYVFRVTGIDNLINDDSVVISIFDAYPTFAIGCDVVSARREYVIARSSITPGGTTLDDARLRIDGRIVAGRLRADGAPTDVLYVPLAGPTSADGGVPTRAVGLHGVRLRFDIAVSGGTSGNLGGSAPAEELISALAADYVGASPDLLPALVDVAVAGVCDEAGPPRRYGALGLGLGFTLLPAWVRADTPIVDARIPGTCGE